MLEQITGRRRILALPARMYNSIVRWCSGIKSETGTVRIKQTGDSASIDVDVQEVARRSAQCLAGRFPMAGDRTLIGSGLKWSGGRLCLDESYLAGVIQRLKGK